MSDPWPQPGDEERADAQHAGVSVKGDTLCDGLRGPADATPLWADDEPEDPPPLPRRCHTIDHRGTCWRRLTKGRCPEHGDQWGNR